MSPREPVRSWVLAGTAYVAALAVLALVGAPSPPLFAGLVGGAVLALTMPEVPPLRHWVVDFGMAVVGVAAGSSIDADVLRTVVDRPVAVVGGVLVTLLVSLLIGQLLRLAPEVSNRTAIFASIAGGASGVSLMAREFGADAPIVISVQYLRVVVVLATVSVVAPLLDHADRGGGGAAGQQATAGLAGLAFTVTATTAGILLARLLPFSASAILAPLAASTVLSMLDVFPSSAMPGWVQSAGYTVVGLMVGIGFTVERLRLLARLLPLALLQIALSIVACAAVGLVFARAVGVTALDGYLATTPGGLPAVVAVAVDSSEALGLVLTMQVVRLFVALLAAAVVGGILRRPGR